MKWFAHSASAVQTLISYRRVCVPRTHRRVWMVAAFDRNEGSQLTLADKDRMPSITASSLQVRFGTLVLVWERSQEGV